MNLQIQPDDLSRLEVRELLLEHLRHMHEITPPESIHALSIEGLRTPGVTLWTAWCDGSLAGCGALKMLTNRHGEIKAMRTASSFRRCGVARKLLTHIIDQARRRGYVQLSLETGSSPEFEAARRLYRAFGFSACLPFDAYEEDPNSVFMTKAI